MDNTPSTVLAARAMIESGLSNKEVARRLGMHRGTHYHQLTGRSDPHRRRRSKLDPYREYIKSLLRSFNLPATVMIEEIREQGYTGRITILMDYMREVKQGHIRRLVERFETEPGRHAQIDCAECGYIDHGSRRRKPIILTSNKSWGKWGDILPTRCWHQPSWTGCFITR